MTKMLAALAAVGAATAMLVSAANAAEPRYDRKLELAAAGIAAAKVGDIRGGFSYRDKPQFVVVRSAPQPPVRHVEPDATRDDGLVPAVDGTPSRLVN